MDIFKTNIILDPLIPKGIDLKLFGTTSSHNPRNVRSICQDGIFNVLKSVVGLKLGNRTCITLSDCLNTANLDFGPYGVSVNSSKH